MAKPIPFRRRRPDRRGWAAAAKGLGPILWALPLAAFTGAWLLGDLPQGEATTGFRATDTERARFARCSGPVRTTCVVDGDTIWYQGTKIRVADINAPEVSKPGCAREAMLGEEATDRLIELLNAGAFTLAAAPGSPDTDRYGRTLREVHRGGESLGAVLVDEGLAEEWGGARIAWC
ncbi:thermonuclease family protein [Leptolyngbya sp. 15MV]|nr:thermonuclease family protein [Leptolyngbya sp. 15MV]